MIKTYDHPLPHWLEQTAQSQFYRYPMEYGHRTTATGPEFFGRTIYNRTSGVQESPPPFIQNLCDYIRLDLVSRLDPQAEFIEFERVVVNGQTGGMAPGPHADYDHDPRYWTAVYFLQGHSGDLKFYQPEGDTLVPFQPHRMAVFNSGIVHEALPPVEGDWRMTIGISWLMTSSINP
jgi:hypothetical protein